MYEDSLFYKDTYLLSKKLLEKCRISSNSKDNSQKQLVNVVDDLLLAWCKEDACFYSQIFQPSVHNDEIGKDNGRYKVQTLILTRPPIWNVNSIVTNQSGSGVLLVGEKGLGVIELPKRWGNPSLFEGGKDVITCKVEYIGEQFLACASNISVISATWYPGSLNYSDVIMLSSDNYLRIYNISSVNVPDKVYPVAKGRGSSESKFGGDIALGETAVAFDIGPPHISDKISHNDGKNSKVLDYIDEAEEIKRRHYNLEWPVFILYSNGDVYYTITSLNKKISHSNALYGPLAMLPNSFDNFGLEFCSLLVLQCNPVVMVIANSKGCLHHCILMEKSEEDSTVLGDIDDLSESISNLNLASPSYVLHVYETVHLDFSSEQDENQLFHMPKLVSDPITPARYWLVHKNGLFIVYVPVVEKLIQHSNLSGKDIFPEDDIESQIEHFLCTKTLDSVKSTSVIGVSIQYSPSNVFVMLETGAIAVLPVPSLYFPSLSMGEIDPNSTSFIQSKKDAFGTFIRSILQRSASQPLLISGADQIITLEDHLNLLKHVQDTLRKNYILPQIKAKEEIFRRRRILVEQKEHLQKEINSMLNEKIELMGKAHNIAEKYEEANDKHVQLMKRLEKVVNYFVRDLPTLSTNEHEMHTEIENLLDKSQDFSSDIAQIKAKHQWHISQKSKQEFNESLQSKQSSYLSENQLACLKVTLGKESDKLNSLVKKIKQSKNELGI